MVPSKPEMLSAPSPRGRARGQGSVPVPFKGIWFNLVKLNVEGQWKQVQEALPRVQVCPVSAEYEPERPAC
eukprot:SAG22_NODE_17800_length_298_cov_0.783920_1_plen_70_part_10